MTRIETMKRIVEDCTAEEIDNTLVDLYSASAYVKVYDNLELENQEKLEGFPLSHAMTVVWGVIAKVTKGTS